MTNDKSLIPEIYQVNDRNFDSIALEIFRQQAQFNPVYSSYLKYLHKDFRSVQFIEEIPFMPISFFKIHEIKTHAWTSETFFTSSTTTGTVPSKHCVYDTGFYHENARRCFEHFFGPLSGYHFFALLPSYLERQHSSLVSMMDYFIRMSGSGYSGFYLYDYEKLLKDIKQARKLQPEKKPVVWGVSFALLELAEQYSPYLGDCLVFETGGMKGRRKEIIRAELHGKLQQAFGVEKVYSEYGMTELLSQAYTKGGSTFYCPPWMRILIRDVADPFMPQKLNKSGAIKVIDLANWRTQAFIETEDSGKLLNNGVFEVLGRLDNTDIRGCNLMLE